MKISAPKGLKDFKLKHTARLMMLSKNESKVSLSNILQYVSAFTDTDVTDLKKVKPQQIIPIFDHCVDSLKKYEKREPVKEIEVNGREYTLVDIHKQKAGWLIDVEVMQEHFETRPETMAALCYIEKGKEYGDIPNKEREDVFREHFPAYLFFDLNAFFLSHYLIFTNALALSTKIKLEKEKKKLKRKKRIKRIKEILLKK